MIDVAKFSIGWSWGREEMLAVGSQVSGRRTIWSIPTHLFQPSLSILMFDEAQNHNHIMKPKQKSIPTHFFQPSFIHLHVSWSSKSQSHNETQNSTQAWRDPNIFQTKLTRSQGGKMLRERGNGVPRKVRVFYKRKDPQHTLFCRKT